MNKFRIRLCSWKCFFLCFLLLFLLIPVSVSAERVKSKTVRVGWFEDSYNITGENGEKSGYGYEYQQTVATYTGWKYEYVKGDWPELLKKLQDGEIDLMGGVSYAENRAKTMLFSELPMGEEKYYLYMNLAHKGIYASDLKSLNGKRIGMLKESIPTTQFCKWEKKHDLHTEHVVITSAEDAKKKIADNKIDGFVSIESPQWGEAGLSAIAHIGDSGIYFVINKNRPDLKEDLDNAMRKMEFEKPFYKEELYKRYLSTVSITVLSGEEQDWLSQHGKIRIGYLNEDSGVSVLDGRTRKVSGIINDYIQYASDCLGKQALKFSLVGFHSREEQMQALKENKIDMIFHVSQNPDAAERNGYILSDTAWTFNLVALTKKKYFDENAANSIAVTKDDFALKNYISYNYPKWKIKEYNSLKKVQKAVKNGEADCFVTRFSQAEKYMEEGKLHSAFLTQPGNASFAVRRGNITLLSILNKTLQTMPSSMLNSALSEYDNAAEKVTLAKFIKDNLVVATTVFASILLFILLLILSFFKKTKQAAVQTMELNKKLEEKQDELQEALLQAKKANDAKTNFLFNMSHDIRTPMNALLGYTELMKKELKNPKLLDYQEKIEQSGNLLLSIINNVLDMARIESGKMEIDENYSSVKAILKEISGVFEEEAKKKQISFTCESQIVHEHIMCDETKVKEILINLVSNAVKYTPSGGKVTVRLREIPSDRKGYIKIKTEVVDNGIGMSKEFLPFLFDSFARERNTTIGKIAGTGLGMPIVKKYIDMMGGSIDVESELGKGTKFNVILQYRIADEIYYEQKEERVSFTDKKEIIQGKHILLAEDNDLNAEIAMTILEDMGLIVERVEDGIKCVAKIEQEPAGSFDLILMDIQMPNMDGYKATQAIRRLGDKQKANIPIIAMTANAFEEDRKEALKRGMNGHIAKPIDVIKVEEVLLSILE